MRRPLSRRPGPAARRAAGAVAVAALLGGWPHDASAQGSPYVPLDDVAYVYIDALQARGLLSGLSMLERPYTAAAVERAAAADTASGVLGRWLLALRTRAAWLGGSAARPGLLAPAALPAAGADTASGVQVQLAIGARATGETTARTELALADGESGVHPGGQLRVSATAGPVVVGARYVLDQRWRDDPDFPGFTDGGVAGRVEDGYVAGQWRYGELFFGRMARNWGPPRLTGLQVGRDAPPYDQLFGRLGTDRLRLALLAARLNDLNEAGETIQRYVTMHRLAARWRGLEVAATETYVYAGADRGFEPSLVNPLAPVLLTHYNEDEDGNVNFAGELHLRTRWGAFGAQGMLDDFQFESGTEATDEPPSYALTVTAEGLPLWGAQRWFASYTRVSNLVYRTPAAGETFVYRGVGLGRSFADYDEWRVGLDVAALQWAPLRTYVARRRQGEGDYRAPFPPVADYDATPAFLAGEVAEITRAAVESGGQVGGLSWRLDVGWNDVAGAGRAVPGARGATPLAESGFVGRVTLSFEPGLLSRRFRLQ